MDTNKIIQALDAEIVRLEQSRVLLVGRTAAPRRAKSVSAKPTARFKPLPLRRERKAKQGLLDPKGLSRIEALGLFLAALVQTGISRPGDGRFASYASPCQRLRCARLFKSWHTTRSRSTLVRLCFSIVAIEFITVEWCLPPKCWRISVCVASVSCLVM
jgi:hypothetical protein